jgi:hypothetical protein
MIYRRLRLRTAPREWTEKRIARVGFLIGLGWNCRMIAEDRKIATSEENLYRQVSRLELSFREASQIRKMQKPFLDAAEKRGITEATLRKRLLDEIAADPVLIDNILDDWDPEVVTDAS